MRATACFRKIGGRWRVVHEHVSLPFDPETEKVAYIPNLVSR
jgi:ketosteroid isomerase-like protein